MANSVVSDDKNKQVVTSDASGDEGEDNKVVSREAYDRAVNQRKADKAKREAAERERDELKAKVEEQEAEQLRQQNQYKQLYDTEKKKREEAEGRLSEMTQSQVTSAKRQALSQALGITRIEYLNLANVSEIQMNDDGGVDPESIKKVANAFRSSYPELLPTRQGGKLPNDAPQDTKPKVAKPLSQMTEQELRDAYAATKAVK